MVKNLQINLESKHRIKKIFIHRVISLLKKDLHFEISSLIINFVTASRITYVNIEFLNHHYSTDIITFNYSDSLILVDAEIYISTENAAENAVKFNASFDEEITRLVIHGVLHISGFDDKTPGEKAKMKRIENKLLNSYKIALFN